MDNEDCNVERFDSLSAGTYYIRAFLGRIVTSVMNLFFALIFSTFLFSCF